MGQFPSAPDHGPDHSPSLMLWWAALRAEAAGRPLHGDPLLDARLGAPTALRSTLTPDDVVAFAGGSGADHGPGVVGAALRAMDLGSAVRSRPAPVMAGGAGGTAGEDEAYTLSSQPSAVGYIATCRTLRALLFHLAVVAAVAAPTAPGALRVAPAAVAARAPRMAAALFGAPLRHGPAFDAVARALRALRGFPTVATETADVVDLHPVPGPGCVVAPQAVAAAVARVASAVHAAHTARLVSPSDIEAAALRLPPWLLGVLVGLAPSAEPVPDAVAAAAASVLVPAVVAVDVAVAAPEGPVRCAVFAARSDAFFVGDGAAPRRFFSLAAVVEHLLSRRPAPAPDRADAALVSEPVPDTVPPPPPVAATPRSGGARAAMEGDRRVGQREAKARRVAMAEFRAVLAARRDDASPDSAGSSEAEAEDATEAREGRRFEITRPRSGVAPAVPPPSGGCVMCYGEHPLYR